MRSTDQAIIHTLQPYAFDTTMPDHATNLLATSSTSASNVKKTTLLSTASTAPAPLSDLKFNPLPKGITTPVNIVNMMQCLSQHPERHMVNYIINGLINGFDIGYANSSLKHCTHNLRSATEHTKDVTTAINKELDRGHMSGPFSSAPLQKLHCSPLGSREKKDGSRRLIMDLSQSRGGSINEGIDKESFKVQYSHFDDATDLVYKMGTNCLMSKIDIHHAFRILPVKQSQWHLLGICRLHHYYINTRLPFGLRSAPNIFNNFANLICWIIHNIALVKNILHYSDNYLLVSPPNADTAHHKLSTVKYTFQHLNIPIATEKITGPSTLMIYLGI